MRIFRLTLYLSTIFIAIISSARAAPVTVEFTGAASFVASPLQATVGTAPTISGVFSYEWDGGTVTDTGSTGLLSTIVGYSSFTIAGLSGDLSYTIGSPGALDTGSAQTFPSSPDDEARLALGPAIGPQVDGKDIVSASLILETLPFTNVNYFPVPSDLATVLLFDKTQMFRVSYGGVSRIDFDMTIVPVPAALWLFISGLFGLTILSRRKTHSRGQLK